MALCSPGFPAEQGGVGELHAAFLTESRTPQLWMEPRTGNPGSGFRLRPILQCLHIGEAVGLLRIVSAYNFRRVVEDHDAVELHLYEGGHDLGHVVISVVHEGFDEVRQRRADIAEMDLPDLFRAEIADHLRRVLMHERRATLVPASATETDTDVGTVGDLHGSFIAFEIGEDTAWNPGQYGLRWIIGVDSYAHAVFFRHRRNLLDEVCVVLPNLFFRKYAPMGKRLI